MGRAPALPPAEQSIFRIGLPRMGSAKVHFARLSRQSMIRKSLPSGFDPMGVQRFSEKIVLKQRPKPRA